MEISTTSITGLHKTHLSLKKSQIKDPKTWNSILRSHTKLKNDQLILNSYTEMEILGISPDCLTLPIVLKACARLKAVEKGKKIHSDIQKTPQLAKDVRVRTALIDFYSKCGLLEEARNVFEETLNRDIVSFNAMICGYVGNSRHEEAIEMFLLMQQRENLKPSSVTLVGLLSACSELCELRLGKEIHCYCLRNRLFDVDPHLGTALIGFYSRFDSRISRLVFDSMTVKNIVTWNSIISGYFNEADKYEALRFFSGMLVDGIEPGSVTILVAIQSCMDFGYLEIGRQIHQLAIKYGFSSDLFIVSALINMYGKNGSLKSSCQLFKTISTRDVVLWNSMLSAYKDCGSHDELFTLFGRMRLEGVREDPTTVAIVLLACSDLAYDLGTGKGLHAHVIKRGMEMDASLKNALLSMYAQLNCVESAEKKFHEMKYPDIVSWNTLILALARNKVMARLFGLFKRMQQSNVKPNSFTMVAILASCEDQESLNTGRSIHGYVIRHGLEINSSLCTALTTMYINCGDEVTARNLFENYRNRDLISWNALITSYVESNRPDEALSLFHQMITEVEPNSVTIINVLSSCAHLSSLPQSRCIHAYAIRREFALGSHISLGNALITTYARCGSILNSENVFRSLQRRDVISWNAMIAGYGMHGFAEKALLAFSQMQELGLSPNSISFVSVLSACSHAGLIDKGWHLFRSMTWDYNITPEVVHYACMVDLLGRGGHLDEAKDFIDSMPIEPDASVWRALLGACRVHSETKLAREVFIKLVELEPMNVGNFILLSNIYAAAGLREDVRKLRAELKMKGLTKDPGNSWIVVRSQVHSFTAGDRSHPQSTKIYKKLSCLTASIMETGYFPDQRWVLQDLKDEEKDQNLLSHSEKLAIAFGLLNMSAGVPILITKNIRVCGDCHTFSKHVSKSVGRVIILRDTTRFHHFVNGVCSCKDYW